MEQWAADIAAPGEQLGVRCLAQRSHLSRGHFLPGTGAQPAKERTQLLFEEMPLFVSTQKIAVSLSVEEVQTFLSLIAEERIQ